MSDVARAGLLDAPVAAAPSRPRKHRMAWVLSGFALAALAAGAAGTGFSYEPLNPAALRAAESARGESARVRNALARLEPKGIYIVIDSGQNQIYLRKGDEVVMQAPCSTGSGLHLRIVDGERSWTFDTPRGEFHVIHRTERPMWKKPDWAFLEEGLPVPEREEDRFEAGVLGEYGLAFGNGFLIHGTLYERLLGQSVTHGCIRVGRDPLRKIWQACPLGTPIYIY